MVLTDGQCLHELASLSEQFVCLASHTHDDIHADECIWDVLPDLFYLLGEELCVVAAMHQFEHFVAATLEGDVEVRHEGSALAAKADDVFCEQVGLYAADTIALDAFHLVECLQ